VGATGVERRMAHTPAVPFALPDHQGPRVPPLDVSRYLVLLVGVLLVPLAIIGLLYPTGLEFVARDQVLAHRATFGFDVGKVATENGDAVWGITSVAPEGPAEVAGLRGGDVIATHHGTPGGFLHGALHDAQRGLEACLDVQNMPARIAGMRLDRTVCLGSARTADPIAPTCPLPSPGGMCPAPAAGDVLVWRAPVHEEGRHALVLRRADGGPEVLVRAFERSVDVMWAPDGGAVAITDHDASGKSTIWVHSGPLLSSQADLTAPIAAALYFPDHFIVYPHRWEDASTLRLTAGEPGRLTPLPMHRFRYRLGATALTPVP
jgi:hypothetical protein